MVIGSSSSIFPLLHTSDSSLSFIFPPSSPAAVQERQTNTKDRESEKRREEKGRRERQWWRTSVTALLRRLPRRRRCRSTRPNPQPLGSSASTSLRCVHLEEKRARKEEREGEEREIDDPEQCVNASISPSLFFSLSLPPFRPLAPCLKHDESQCISVYTHVL